ncbi:magnesium transporter MRS2-11, chloroplastic [Trifolium repens]|nr:magnesium transporter MRS2-11, chloroplastic [Trifolium repens]
MWEQLESNGVVISKYQHGQQELQVISLRIRSFFAELNEGLTRELAELKVEDEEIEMLLENYLQRCESCHCQAERLLDSAREMENTIAVRSIQGLRNLSDLPNPCSSNHRIAFGLSSLVPL